MQGRDIVVSVEDGGPGISQQDLPHIFEKYFRASGTRKKEGLGIGLYGARLLVQAHGGRIWADSALGEGTTSHVALPDRARGGGLPSLNMILTLNFVTESSPG